MSTDRLLIVNADDFGRTAGVSAGILEGHVDGVVSSTSTMVNLPAAESSVRRAAAEAPTLGIGIHLNLTSWKPVLPPSEIPTLINRQGEFYPIRDLAPRLSQIDPIQAEAELAAQIEMFNSWGNRPTHLDCHHHLLYLDPCLFRVLVGLAQRHDLPIRYPWRQGATSPQDLEQLAEAHRIPASALPGIIAECDAILAQSNLRAPDRSILSFFGPTATLEHILKLIAELPKGTSELMCHPGYVDRDLENSSYSKQREAELAVLTDPRVKAALQARGAALIGFDALERRD